MKTDYLKFTLLLFALTSCSNGLTKISSGKKIDDRLVGVWAGSEQDQQIEGAQKIWKMTRNDDGTFLLNFKTIIKGESDEFTEKGNWWVKNGKFYEFHDNSGETDIYKYEVLDNNRIKFISKQINIEMNTESYQFIDTRK
ncbi:hypothetical protein GCM10007423_39190 [Dyadobacter endophyticus]|uniref:Lipocalin-like domain-containing protein n=1 Tax=Dyadobacter endophyticus TaxID=1749036 RepID=A0ABQ1YYM1_9BACT|nr:lipocalin family protein [Dyadobacter endophyticus]GGH42498.1 hypothetical protein GCM10007423_39190 [Dyadobacter endophyticus]